MEQVVEFLAYAGAGSLILCGVVLVLLIKQALDRADD